MSEDGRKFWSGFVGTLSPDSTKGLRNITALFILVFSLMYTGIFLITIDNLKQILGWLLYPFFSLLMYFIIILLFSSDKLYQGHINNKFVNAFQLYWPSKHLAKKFNIPVDEASHYWFENFFNKWAHPDHPRHGQFTRTLKRGYECRFIYYCIQFLNSLLVLSTLSLILIVYILPIFPTIITITHQVNTTLASIFIILIGLLNFIIRHNNRTTPTNLTGVWERFEEINKMHRRWIDDHINSIEELKAI